MSETELMEELALFMKERGKTHELTKEMIKKGIPLFDQLRKKAYNWEIRQIARSYYKHLKLENV